MPETTKAARGREGPPLFRASRRGAALRHLISDSWLPALWENTFSLSSSDLVGSHLLQQPRDTNFKRWFPSAGVSSEKEGASEEPGRDGLAFS